MKRVMETVAMLLVGDGVIALVAPRRHSYLWEFGPEGYRRAMEAFAQRPGLTLGSWPQRRSVLGSGLL